ncbi:hypothetical protein [Nocardioides mesophilus]|uniref:Uncharacterized protein n=1 Tax=Nocardioides mesophilus TaxID=433659 RepID=A0A7G9RDP4_9ACTN|nr:hypothetical protein [Nocardioides mesophilus]QNN53719.1 hypothetical protein H9L09_04690 [Nocardioides mesophilus]
MSDALELQVLVAVGAGRRTLDALSRTLRVPAPAVDERIRRAIGEGLLVARQQDGTWVFDLTDAGRQLVAARAGAGGGAGLSPSGSPAGLAGAVRALISQAPGGSSPWPAASARRRAPSPSQPTSPPTSSPSSGTTHLLSPTEEAQRAERAAWSFAVAVVGAVVVLVLLVWLLAAG